MSVLRKYSKVFIALAFPVYLLLLVNSISNMHVHVLSNGMVVRHAHPFNKENGDKGSHEHTKSEISYYQGFFLDYFDNTIPLISLIIDFPLLEEIADTASILYSFLHAAFAPLRAPPVS